MFRVVIIGGGPAASAMACSFLAAAPADSTAVTVVEARTFPRSKVCGEFLSPAATADLLALADEPTLRAAGAAQVKELVIEHGHRRRAWPLPMPAWTLSRSSLDALLIDRAKALGATVMQPDRVESVVYEPAACAFRLASGQTIPADIVVHADGSGRHDAAGPTPARRGVVGLKCFIRPPGSLPGIRMRSCRGAYVGTVMVESGLTTVALVTRASLLRACGSDPDVLLARLWPGYQPAWRIDPWLSCGVASSCYRPPGSTRSFRIGNAAAAVEPVGGEGIGLALWSGRRLGTLLAEALSARDGHSLDNAALESVQSRLAREYRHRLRARRPACRLAAEVLMRPWLVGALWPLLSVPALTIGPWYALTGKPRPATR